MIVITNNSVTRKNSAFYVEIKYVGRYFKQIICFVTKVITRVGKKILDTPLDTHKLK